MAEERAGPVITPAGLVDDWPVEWQPVWGVRDGFFRRWQAKLFSGVMELGARLPFPVLDVLLGIAARLAMRMDKRHTAAAKRFLRQALGELPEAEVSARVLQSYRHFFRIMLEPRRFRREVDCERSLEHFDVRWSDDIRRLVESDQGCLIVTAHIGNWEAAIAAAPRLGLHPLYAVAKPPKHRPLSILVQRERELGGVRLLPRKGAMRDAPRILRAGGSLALLLDQRARQRPVLAPFFGRPARCDRSAGVLMKRLNAPTLVVGCFLTEKPLHYVFEFVDCILPEELREAGPADIATRLNRSFEKMILAYPEQYFWIHDRYKRTPEEFPPEEGGPSNP